MEEPRACIAFVLRLSDKRKLEMTPVLLADLVLIRVIARKFTLIKKIVPLPVVSCVLRVLHCTAYVGDQLSYCMASCDLKPPAGLSEGGREFVPDT